MTNQELQNSNQGHKRLQDREIIILIADGVDEKELIELYQRLTAAGASVTIVAPTDEAVQCYRDGDPMTKYEAQAPATEINARTATGLVLPGGVFADDDKVDPVCIKLVREFFKLAKPVAAIEQGIQWLVAADVIHDRKITSCGPVREQAISAGALWSDVPCMCEQGLVTARTRRDMDAFCDKAIEEFVEGTHVGQTV